MAAGVTSAFVHDKTGARVLQDDVEDHPRVKTVVAGGAYQGEVPFDRAEALQWQMAERLEKGKFSPLPVRWIVERTFAWLQNYRRLARDYEKTVVSLGPCSSWPPFT